MVEPATPRNGGSRPVPDPTILTTEQITREVEGLRREIAHEREIIQTRLDGIDKATELLGLAAAQVPSDVSKEVGHLHDIMQERFESIDKQFRERDTRSERESRDNKVAVDAAFAAQKEAAAKQDEANQKSIDKSEKATNDSINKLGDVVTAANKALSDKIDDVKSRLGATELMINGMAQNRLGGTASTRDRRDSITVMIAIAAIVVTIIIALAGIGITLNAAP